MAVGKRAGNMHTGHEPISLPFNTKISSLFTALALTIFLTFTLGMFCFGENFLFWQHAFSDLGSTITPCGNSNLLSLSIFVMGMLISAVLMILIACHFSRDESLNHRQLKYYLSLLAALGFIVITYPHNLNNQIHSYGAATMVGSLWAFGVLLLVELKPLIFGPRYNLYQALLQGTVLTYAFTYFINAPIKQVTQKFAVVGLVATLKLATSQSVLRYIKKAIPRYREALAQKESIHTV